MTGDGSGSAIKGQVFTSGGVKSGEAFTVNTSTTDDQKYPTVTALANGDAFVTWTDYDGATSDIYSQVINLQSYVGDGSAETVHGGSLGDTSRRRRRRRRPVRQRRQRRIRERYA